MLMRNIAAAMTDVGAKADNAIMKKRSTVIRESDAAAMDAGHPLMEEITSVTHQDHHHHHLRLAKVAEAERQRIWPREERS